MRYAADFLSDTEASALLRECEALDGWRSLSQRRMLSVGGTPHPDGAWAEPLPACLEGLASRVAPYLGGVRADQALLNDYDVGGGIDPHMDGPLYEPHAVILSLAPARLDFYDGGDTRVASVLLRETPAWEVFPWHGRRDGGRSFALEPPGGDSHRGRLDGVLDERSSLVGVSRRMDDHDRLKNDHSIEGALEILSSFLPRRREEPRELLRRRVRHGVDTRRASLEAPPSDSSTTLT